MRFYIAYLAQRVTTDERGASLVEYALLVGLIAIVCITSVAYLGNSLPQHFSEAGSTLDS